MNDKLCDQIERERDTWKQIAARLAARLMSKPYNEFDKAALEQYLDYQENGEP